MLPASSWTAVVAVETSGAADGAVLPSFSRPAVVARRKSQARHSRFPRLPQMGALVVDKVLSPFAQAAVVVVKEVGAVLFSGKSM